MTKEVRRVSESLSSPEIHHGSIGSAAAPAAVRRAPRRTLQHEDNHPEGRLAPECQGEGAVGSARGGRAPRFQFSPTGNPPALPEDSRSLTAPGVIGESLDS